MTESPRAIVGFIGVGRMGLPMCHNLLSAGHALTVSNRTLAKAAPLTALGANAVATAREVATEAQVIITCLDTVAASESVYLGPDGLVERAQPGALLVEHSTIPPALARCIAAAADARGVAYLDAPVSGGPEGAERGTLAIMVGGEVAAFERAWPVLSAYGQAIHRMGPVGAGSQAKLVNQLLTFVHGAAAAEAIAFAQHVGLDLEALGDVMRASFAHSRMLDRTLARVTAHQYDAGAALRLYDKDLGIVQQVGTEHELVLPVTTFVRDLLASAMAEGLGDADIAALHLRYPGPAPREVG